MAWWRREHTPKDERLEALKGLVYKEAYFLIATICGVSAIYKYWYLGLEWTAVTTELVALLAAALYTTVRSITLGIMAGEAEMHERTSRWPLNKKATVMGLLAGVIIAFLFGLRSATVYGDESTRLQYFIMVFLVSFLLYVPLLAIASLLTAHVPRVLSEKFSKRE